MKKVLKLFFVFSMCLSQLFFAALYSNVSAIQDDDQIVEEVDQDNTEKDTTSETTQDESENNNGEEIENNTVTEETDNLDSESNDVHVVQAFNENTEKEVVNINESWTFTNYDNKSSTVNLPYCWEYVHPTMSYIPQMNSKTCTYEKTLDVSKYKNKNLFLKFYGANKNTVLYIDGKKVGEHVGGFSAFIFDITEYVKNDTIKIKVETVNIDTASIPVNSDFTHWAGLYRDVELIATNDAYISTEDNGTKGIYVSQSFSGNNAIAKIKTKFSSKGNENKDFKVVTTILNNEGQEVSKNEQNINLLANTTCQENVQELTVENVHRWNGTKDPYLYTVKVELKDMEENVYDSQTQKVGFRTFKVKDGNFYLNGKLYKLNGVGMHQDREGYGNATTKEMKEEDINTIMEMGANAIRTAHYAHDQSLYDLADEKGLIVWTEIPFYLLMADTTTFRETTKQQLVELIRQNYNHPSIICWGIQNEVNTNPQFASYGQEFNVSTKTLSAFMKELASLAKKEDSSRFVVQAHIDGTEKLKESLNWTRNSDIDYTGFNLYYGFKTEVKAADETGREIIKGLYSNKIDSSCDLLGQDSIIISEYGAGGNIDQHATINSDFSWSGNDTAIKEHPEEYQSYVLESAYDAISKQDNVWVAFVWNMFDFSSYRNSGGKERTNNKGLVCYDHKTRKDSFYFYKANWNKNDKFVYITSRRKTERTANDSTIKVYSNCENVRLVVAGKDYGYGKLQQKGVFTWDNVKYVGDNTEIQAIGESGDKEYTDSIVVNGPNNKDDVSVKYKSQVQDYGWQSGWQKDGSTSGTIGESKRLEAVRLELTSDVSDGEILYKSHVQDEGWQSKWKSDGQISGTVGIGKRLEAIQIKLNGNVSKKYNVYYRVHVQDYGWLDWAKNGEQSGSDAYSIEAYQIAVLPAGNKAPGKTVYTYHTVDMEMEAHVSDIGWQNKENNGNIIGTTGKAKGIEAYSLSVAKENLGISYASCINGEWQQEVKDGQTSGTTGQAKHIEAIKIQLTGTEKENYHVYYRVHVSNIGWLDWTCDGEAAGTKNYNYPIEAIQIEVVSSDSDNIPEVGEAYKEKIDNVRYCAHVSDIGWQSSVTNGDIAGTTGKNKAIEALKIETDLENLNIEYTSCNKKDEWQSWTNKGEATGTVGAAKALEAIKIKLSGESSSEYHVYYRVYVSNFGWLDWTSDGEPAGTNGYGYNIEALQIKVMKEGESEIPELGESYREKGKGISYRAHVRNLGWQQYVENGNQAGTTGKALCVEALQIEKPNIEYDGNIEYRAHVSDIGWQNWVNDGEVAGTTGRAKAIEAIQIKLTGEIEKKIDI